MRITKYITTLEYSLVAIFAKHKHIAPEDKICPSPPSPNKDNMPYDNERHKTNKCVENIGIFNFPFILALTFLPIFGNICLTLVCITPLSSIMKMYPPRKR